MSVKVNETICPYCGSNLVREKRPLLGDILCCPNTPNCDAYVLVTTEPDIGIPGNSFLRSLRKRGHRYLDIICDGRMENKDALYNEMSEHLHLIGKYAHFRYMGVHECIDAILFLIDYIAKNYYRISGSRRLSVEQAELFMSIANMEADFDSEIYYILLPRMCCSIRNRPPKDAQKGNRGIFRHNQNQSPRL